MSTGKTNLTSTQFAAKKLLGKAHTSNLFGDINESIPSNVSMPSDGVYAEAIPNSPGDDFYTLYSASVNDPGTVERVYFDVVSLASSIYTATDSGGGGDESSENGPHGYYLKLPSNYETTSSNPNAGTGVFTNGKRIYDSRGGLQLVHPLISNASPNKYFLKLYKGDATNPANEITSGDSIDWQVDYYAGTIFIQDYKSSTVPVSASAYLYVGKYLNEKLSDISASAGSGTITALNNQAENRLVTIGSTTTELDGEANLTFDGSSMNLTGTLNVSGAINANELNITVTNRDVINLTATGSTNFGDSNDDTHVFTGRTRFAKTTDLGNQNSIVLITGSSSDFHFMIGEDGNDTVADIAFAVVGSSVTEAPNVAGKVITSFELSSSNTVSASNFYGAGDLQIGGESNFDSTASFNHNVNFYENISLETNKALFFDGTTSTANQGPYIFGNAFSLFVHSDNNLFFYYDTETRFYNNNNDLVFNLQNTSITSSIDFQVDADIHGSGSTTFGSLDSDTHIFTGSVGISASSNSLNLQGIVSGTIANTSSYLALDSNNNVIKVDAEALRQAAGGGGGSDENLNYRTVVNSSRTEGSLFANVRVVLYAVTGNTGAINFQLRDAADLDAGKSFVIKDESGLADSRPITILASGSQTIDGQSSIVLESPYAAVNIYSNGVDKYFIY